jgi:hypothetical protein
MNNKKFLHRGSPPKHRKSLSRRISMSLTHLSNVAKGRNFMNESTRLSHDLICKMLILSLS